MISPCLLCSAECCKNLYITVTAFDVLRISESTGRAVGGFAEIYPLKLINFDNETVLECWDGKYPAEYILCIKSHPCFFLEGGRCTIHDFSPCVCRSFPKGVDGRFKTRLCPIPAGFLFRVLGTNMPRAYAEELDCYKETVAEWNRGKGKVKDCMEFLLKKTKARIKS
ncbi:YkgJ family cysteine cluster protein [Candidatus Micrarchaeota archaeon]|nr:YkgJ family cysteine cluster protein [Candidatus Micrarchaeota archaeon]